MPECYHVFPEKCLKAIAPKITSHQTTGVIKNHFATCGCGGPSAT
jgi:hypothetical protein